jgi:hypothetical protein
MHLVRRAALVILHGDVLVSLRQAVARENLTQSDDFSIGHAEVWVTQELTAVEQEPHYSPIRQQEPADRRERDNDYQA